MGFFKKKEGTDEIKVLSDVSPGHSFWFYDGKVVRNIYELAEAIKSLDDYGFTYHSNDTKDDFVKWLRHALGDYALAKSLEKERNQKKYIKKIEKRIKNLEKSKQFNLHVITPTKVLHDSILRIMKKEMPIIAMMLIVVVFFLMNTQSEYYAQISSLEEDVYSLGQENTLLQKYLTDDAQKRTELEELAKELKQETPGEISIYSYEERFAPYDRIKEEQIKIYDDKVVIMLDDARWAKFTSTGSMMPTLEKGTNAIEIVPVSPEEIFVGDIISFQDSQGEQIIIHRVVERGEDEQGWYFITKGDNNNFVDPYKVRFSQIKRVLVGLIY